MNTPRAAAVLLLVVAACSSESTGSDPGSQSDAGASDGSSDAASDVATDTAFDVWNHGEGQSYHECMAEICADDLYDVCCCNPTSVQLTASEACTYDYPTEIPTQYGSYTPFPDMVLISLIDDNGDKVVVPWVADESECDEGEGFYYEYEEGGTVPERIVLCPDTSDAANGTIVFQTGCYTIVCC